MSRTRREFMARITAGTLFSASVIAGGVRARRSHGVEQSGAEQWRQDFPAIDQVVGGRPLVYLDSAATTHRPQAVLDAMTEFYARDNANPSPTLHVLARRAADRYAAARRTVARFLHASDPEEIVFVRGTTEGINLVATAWGARLDAGDEIVLTRAEHYSNLLPWRLLAEHRGVTLRWADVDDEGRVRVESVERQLSRRTRLVAITHASNVVGFLNPVEAICARAHRVGARVLLDAAQSAPHVPVDAQAIGCDFLTLSSHKMLGPMGTGVLWARRELLDEMPPYQSGSNMAHEVDLDGPIPYEHGAAKFGAGTPNVAGAIGLAAAIDYLERIGRDAIREHEQRLVEYALTRLADIRGLRLLGPKDRADRIPVFSFSIAGQRAAAVAEHLDAMGVAVRAGDLAARPLLKRLGVDEAVRASCYLYTSAGDIDRLAAALQALRPRPSAM